MRLGTLGSYALSRSFAGGAEGAGGCSAAWLPPTDFFESEAAEKDSGAASFAARRSLSPDSSAGAAPDEGAWDRCLFFCRSPSKGVGSGVFALSAAGAAGSDVGGGGAFTPAMRSVAGVGNPAMRITNVIAKRATATLPPRAHEEGLRSQARKFSSQ